MAIPYVKPRYDDRAHTARMSDLIRAQGASQAEAIRRGGENTANLVRDLTQIGGRALSDIINYKADEPRRRLYDAQTAAAEDKLSRQRRVDEVNRNMGGWDDQAREASLRQAGLGDEADQLRQRSMDQKLREFQTTEATRAIEQKRDLEDIMRTTAGYPPKELAKVLWTRGHFDEAQKVEAAEAKRLDDAAQQKLDQLKNIPGAMTSAAKLLAAPITDQADLTARRQNLSVLAEMVGMPALMNAIPEQFGPDVEAARTRALGWLGEQKAPSSEFSMFYNAWAKEHGQPTTARDAARLLRMYSDATETPKEPKPEVTPQDVRAAKVRRANRINDLALARDKGDITQEQFESGRERADRDYREEIAAGPRQPLGSASGAASVGYQGGNVTSSGQAPAASMPAAGGSLADLLRRPSTLSSRPDEPMATPVPGVGAPSTPVGPGSPAPQALPGPGGAGTGPVTIKLPDGRLLMFPSRDAAEAFAMAAGMRLGG